MGDWKKVKDLITPGNLVNLGNPSYFTLAACLNLLMEYKNGPAKEDDDAIKVNVLKPFRRCITHFKKLKVISSN